MSGNVEVHSSRRWTSPMDINWAKDTSK